jgi:uncharacterized protein YndB with AHSA1/START domain
MSRPSGQAHHGDAADRDARDGKLEQADGRWRLRFERVLPHPPEKVWRALTEEAHLAAWFPTTIEGELRPGAPLEFRFREGEYPASTGEVIECIAPRVLEFTWGYSEEDIDTPERSRFELTPEGDGCRLTFTTTYDRVGKSARDAAGWHVCFDLLEEHLAGEPASPHSPERWKPLNRHYIERFGPDAGTIGPPESFTESGA